MVRPSDPCSLARRITSLTRCALLICFASLVAASQGDATEYRVDWVADLTGDAGDVTVSGTIGTFDVSTYPQTFPIPIGTTLTTTPFGGLGTHEWTLVADGVGITIEGPTWASLSTISGTGSADGGTTPCAGDTCGLTLSTSPNPPKIFVSIDNGASTLTSEGRARLSATLVREPGPATLTYTSVGQSAYWYGYRRYCTLWGECWVSFPSTSYSKSSPLWPRKWAKTSLVVDSNPTPDDFSIQMTGVATADGILASGDSECENTDDWGVSAGEGHLRCTSTLSGTFTVDKATEVIISYDGLSGDGATTSFTFDDGPTFVWIDSDREHFETTKILIPGQTYQFSFMNYYGNSPWEPYMGDPLCEVYPCSGSWNFSLEVVNPPAPPVIEPVPSFGVVGLIALICTLGLGGWRFANKMPR